MKNVLIVGAGGFGREVLSYLRQHPDNGLAWTIRGFIDDNERALLGRGYEEPIICSVEDYVFHTEDVLICALGGTESKKKVCKHLLKKGASFMSYIHPSANIGSHVSLGVGCVLAPFVNLTTNVVLGDFVTLNTHSGCGHDVRVGAYSTLSSFCDLTGGVELGERVFMGSHATVIPKRRVGDGAYIGAGSVVVTHVKAGQKVFGIPAKHFNF